MSMGHMDTKAYGCIGYGVRVVHEIKWQVYVQQHGMAQVQENIITIEMHDTLQLQTDCTLTTPNWRKILIQEILHWLSHLVTIG